MQVFLNVFLGNVYQVGKDIPSVTESQNHSFFKLSFIGLEKGLEKINYILYIIKIIL